MSYELFNQQFKDFEDAVEHYAYGILMGWIIDTDKATATEIIDNPHSSEKLKQNALAFAEAYKRNVQIGMKHGPKNRAILVNNQGKQIGFRAR